MPATKATKTAAKATSTITLSSVYAKYAAKKDIDTTRAAKLVRSRLRSNFDKVCEFDSGVRLLKKSANDGNRWPATVSKELADFILG